MDQIKIGLFLKRLRNEKELTQEQLAEHFHVSSRTISRWETGSNMPDLALLVEIADYYHVDIREIMNGERKSENMNREEKETLLCAAAYADNEKKLLLKRVRLISIIGAVTMVLAFAMTALETTALTKWGTLAVYSYTKGACFGISFGSILCSIFYTTGVLEWLQQKKHASSKKFVLLVCAVVFSVLFVLAFAESFR